MPVRSRIALPRWSPAIAVAALDPEAYLRIRQRRDGDPFGVRLPGTGKIWFTGHPDGAREIFRSAPSMVEPPVPNPIEPLLGSGSLILLRGSRHTRERKVMMPPFHGPRMRGYGTIIQQAALAEIDRWQPGARVRVLPAMQAITLEVIIRAVFGVEHAARRAEYSRVIRELLRSYSPPLLLMPPLRRTVGGRGPWARFTRLRARLDALLRAEIELRRRSVREGADTAATPDVLALLLAARYDDGTALTDDDLLDELRTLLVAGHETTATAAAWALYEIHHRRETHTRLMAELGPLESPPPTEILTQLPYLGAICSESLRRHPVVPIVLRRAVEPMTLRGHEVAPGQSVGIAVPLLHADPSVWPEPSRFLPERFLDRTYAPFEYAPFGGGHRRCLGAAFAGYEMRIIVGTIMAQVSLALRARDRARPLPRSIPKNITTGPRRELVLTVGDIR